MAKTTRAERKHVPKVSVCIPTYNRAALLLYAVNSVLHQTDPDFELIICDDGSTDNTAKRVTQLRDPKIRYIRHSRHIGKSNNMRSGFEAAKGAYFIKLDDDDGLTPDFLGRTSHILDRHANVDFVGTDHWIIDIHGIRDEAATRLNSHKWGRTNLGEGVIHDLLETVFVNQSLQMGATLFRRRVLKAVDFVRPDFQSCEDNDLFVRLALAGRTGYYIAERLMEYRFHAQQQDTQKAISHLESKMRYLESYRFESKRLETLRHDRLNDTRLSLGLRLLENGDTDMGRRLLRQSIGVVKGIDKAAMGLLLSCIPVGWRRRMFQGFRRMRPDDYALRMRNTAGKTNQ